MSEVFGNATKIKDVYQIHVIEYNDEKYKTRL